MIFLGLTTVIVYFLPRGVTGLLEDGWAALGRPLELQRGPTGPLLDAWACLMRADFIVSARYSFTLTVMALEQNLPRPSEKR